MKYRLSDRWLPSDYCTHIFLFAIRAPSGIVASTSGRLPCKLIHSPSILFSSILLILSYILTHSCWLSGQDSLGEVVVLLFICFSFYSYSHMSMLAIRAPSGSLLVLHQHVFPVNSFLALQFSTHHSKVMLPNLRLKCVSSSVIVVTGIVLMLLLVSLSSKKDITMGKWYKRRHCSFTFAEFFPC